MKHAVKTGYVETCLRDGSSYRVPYWHVDSGKDGPSVLVTAALHGTELQGSEMLRQFLPTLRKKLLRGSCMLFPFANPAAVRRQQPHIDFEFGRNYGRDRVNNVNGTWPGKADGSSAQRLSHALYEAVVKPATHLIDLHCWQRKQAATGLARTGRQDSLDVVNASGLPFGRHSEWEPHIKQRPVTPCTLSSIFHDTDRTAMTVEFSGQYGFWPEQLNLGLGALTNVFRHFHMLAGAPRRPARPTVWLNDSKQIKVKAPTSGVFVPASVELGGWIDRGEPLGHIFAIGSLKSFTVEAPGAGYLWRMGPMHTQQDKQVRMLFHPYVEKGEQVAETYAPR